MGNKQLAATQKVGAKQTLVSASGLTAILLQVVPVIADDKFHALGNTIAPFIAGLLTYFGAGIINRYGFEPPEDAELRRRLNSDLSIIDDQLKLDFTDEKTREMLQQQRFDTVRALTSIGRGGVIHTTEAATEKS